MNEVLGLILVLCLVSYGHAQILATMGDTVEVLEGNTGSGTVMSFTVSLSQPVTSSSSVSFSVIAGTATAGVDYLVPSSSQVTFLAGASKGTITIPIVGDTNVEPSEDFQVILTTGTGVTPSFPIGSLGIIVNDDGSTGTLSGLDSRREALGFTTVTLTLSEAQASDVSFKYRTFTDVGNTATGNEDYMLMQGTATISAGDLSTSITIVIIDDVTGEEDETFTFQAYEASGFALQNDDLTLATSLKKVITIEDDDVALTVSDVTLEEGTSAVANTSFVFTLSLSRVLESGESAIVSVSLVDGTTDSDDFGDLSALNSNYTFGVGDQSQLVTIFVNADSDLEQTEEFQIIATVVSSEPSFLIQSGSASYATGTILSDDTELSVTLVQDNHVVTSVGETVGELILTAQVSGDNTLGIAGSFDVLVQADTALNTVDYTTNLETNDLRQGIQTISWADGETPSSFTFTVTVQTDAVEEDTEFFSVLLDELNNINTVAPISFSYEVLDETVTISVGNATAVLEGGSLDSNMLVFPITVSGVLTEPLTLTFEGDSTVGDELAIPGVDYIAPTTLEIAAGTTTATLMVSIIGDSDLELNETVVITLLETNGTDILFGDNPGFGVITNDDIAIFVEDTTSAEGDIGFNPVTVRVFSTSPFPASSSVTLLTSVGTADTDDFVVESVLVSLPEGAFETTAQVQIRGDLVAEGPEDFFVEIVSGINVAAGSPAFGIVTILNDDGPALSVAATSALESSGILTFTLTLNSAPEADASVLVSTGALGSATAGTDYIALVDEEVLFMGNTTAEISITLLNDAVAEATETMTLNFANATKISVATNLIPVGRIVNDDGVRFGFLNTADFTFAEGTGVVTSVTLEIGPVTAVGSVDDNAMLVIETIAGTATADNDYDPIVAEEVALGVDSVFVTLQVFGDSVGEGTEEFFVRLFWPDYVFFGSPVTEDLTETITILEDDYTANITGLVGLEGDLVDGNSEYVFSVQFSGPVSDGSSVTYQTVGGANIGEATAGEDFIGISSFTRPLSEGDLGFEITVTVIGDDIPEDDEVFSVELTASNLVRIGTPSSATGTILNDDFTLTISPRSTFELDTSHEVTFTYTIDGPAPAGSAVTFQTVDGTAIAGVDYLSVSENRTVPTGDTEVNVTVTILGDAVAESTKTFSIEFSDNVRLLLPTTVSVVTIVNDDGPIISVAPASDEEGTVTGGQLVFVVTAESVPADGASFKYQTLKVSASSGDFVEITTPTEISFAPGSSSVEVIIDIVPDSDSENTETMQLQLSEPNLVSFSADDSVDGTISAVGEIINDDGLSITIIDLLQAEGSSEFGNETTTFTFVANLVGGTAVSGTNVQYTVVGGTATEVEDFTTTSGLIEFTAGTATTTFDVVVVADNDEEDQEDFYIYLNTPNFLTLDGFTNATGTISNDDSILTINDSSVLEGLGGSTTVMLFDFELSGPAPPAGAPASFTWETIEVGEATEGIDFVAASNTFTFAEGETTGQIAITIVGDDDVEADEMFQISITSSTNLVLAQTEVNGTILSDDIQVNVLSEAFYEGDSQYVYSFPIIQSAASPSTASVTYVVMSGTAVNGTDFTLLSETTVELSTNDTRVFIDFMIEGNTIPEGDKYFTVMLTACDACALGVSTMANITLYADDYLISFEEEFIEVVETEAPFNITVELTSQPLITDGPNPMIVVETVEGTALDGEDFVSRSVMYTFDSGDTGASFVVTILGDEESEGDESFTIRLTSPVGLKVGTPSTSEVTILDNDARLITVSNENEYEGGIARETVEELPMTNMTFTISLSGPAPANSSLSYMTMNGTAIAGEDYESVSGSYNFTEGELSFEVVVQVFPDTKRESSEVFYLVITEFEGDLETDDETDGTGVIRNDDYSAFGVSGIIRGELRINNRED